MHNLGPDLVRSVRAGFVMQGTTLGAYCRNHNIRLQHARSALLGGWNGPKGTQVREQLLQAAGLNGLPVREAA
jgi:hypothetical protein